MEAERTLSSAKQERIESQAKDIEIYRRMSTALKLAPEPTSSEEDEQPTVEHRPADEEPKDEDEEVDELRELEVLSEGCLNFKPMN